MPGLLRPSLAAAGVGAAVALAAAIPGGAAAAPQRATATHHQASAHHMKHLSVNGLVAAHHGRHVTVFAKHASAGRSTRHNKRVTVRFARSTHARVKMPVGDRIRVSAIGRAHGNHFTVVRHNDEAVTAAPASLFFGTIDAINGNLLTVTEQNRDNGDHESGRDHHHGHDDGDDNDARTTAHDHGPGGDNSGPGHRIVIDDSTASTTVDGSTDTPLAVGDTVAVLGESSNDTIVAAQIFGFTHAPAFLRGTVNAIDGNNVTVGDDNDRDDGSDRAVGDDHGHDGDDDSVTVSLAGVPLVLNGDAGAAPSDLVVGDKLVLIGSIDTTTGDLMPELAFAFNHRDDNPCGHNDGGDDHGHDGNNHDRRDDHDHGHDGNGHDRGDDHGHHGHGHDG
jgi:hypothetical protein